MVDHHQLSSNTSKRVGESLRKKTAMLGLSGGAWPWVYGSSSGYVSPWVLEHTYCHQMIVLPTTVRTSTTQHSDLWGHHWEGGAQNTGGLRGQNRKIHWGIICLPKDDFTAGRPPISYIGVCFANPPQKGGGALRFDGHPSPAQGFPGVVGAHPEIAIFQAMHASLKTGQILTYWRPIRGPMLETSDPVGKSSRDAYAKFVQMTRQNFDQNEG